MSTVAAPSTASVPAEVDRWNWGAFLLTWIWGIGNNVLVALLALIPIVGFVMMLVLGIRGSRWAWRSKSWESVEQFRRVQRKWAIAGAVIWLVLLGFFVAAYFAIAAMFKGSDVYRDAMAKVTANEEAARILGPPLEFGFPMGAISVSGPSGEAHLSIPVQGRKGVGTVYLEATKRMGQWEFERIELEVEGREGRIDLGSKSPRGEMI